MTTLPQNLLIDLDDTICENNVYFERAIAKFISFLNHREMSVEEVRQVLNQVERESILSHGYGLHSFAHSLVKTFERLSVERVTPELHDRIWGFAHEIAEHPMELIDGVSETLEELHWRRHRLIVMTKGNVTEQSGKIERSGLGHFFDAVEIVAEKNRPTYESILDKYGLDPDRSWMVGNSPKSDINPSLAAGLNAIFIPHDQTWVLEHEEVCEPPNGRKLLVLQRFRQLVEHF
jgi:putative hydrolase of the HAD superfamily